jgi:hypothetical protein
MAILHHIRAGQERGNLVFLSDMATAMLTLQRNNGEKLLSAYGNNQSRPQFPWMPKMAPNGVFK